MIKQCCIILLLNAFELYGMQTVQADMSEDLKQRVQDVVAERKEFDAMFGRSTQLSNNVETAYQGVNQAEKTFSPRSRTQYSIKADRLDNFKSETRLASELRSSHLNRMSASEQSNNPLHPPESNVASEQLPQSPDIQIENPTGWNQTVHPNNIGSGRTKRGNTQICGAICCCLFCVTMAAGGIYALVEYS